MRRRGVLLALVLVLVLINVAFFTLRQSDANGEAPIESSNPQPEEVAANWVAFMPDFEASQRSDPQVFGVHEGPPPNDPIIIVDGEPTSRLSMVAGKCEIDNYAVRNSNDSDNYMPERLFVQNLSAEQKICLSSNLPQSYKLSRLKEPTKPSQILWSADLSSLIADESE